MKKLGFFAGIMFAFGLQTFAQETYEIATIEQAELTGTARHIGMGGAMGHLVPTYPQSALTLQE